MTKYQNGVYQTSAQGLHGPVEVETTLSDDRITKIEVLRDPGEYQEKANPVVTAAIIAKQDPKVDAVSGATVSSNAIMEAVQKALDAASGEKSSSDLEDKTIQADLTVIAAGPAGLAAAISASEKGLKVVVFEKQAITGGTANMGMGPLGIDTPEQRQNFNGISVQDALANQLTYTHYRVDSRLVARYFRKSADTIAWLKDMGIQFVGAFRYFKESEATWHIVKNESGKIGPGCASAMMKKMTEHAKELGVEFYLETPVKKILMKDGKVSGVIAESASVRYTVTSPAVVVATGGYGSNEKMLESRQGYHLNHDFFTFNVPGIKGDGLKMMWQSGAKEYGDTVEMIYLLPHNLTYMTADGVLRQPNLLINQNGDRFMNEEMMGNTTFTGNAINLQPGHYAYCIMDRKILKQYQDAGPDIVDLVHSAEGFKHLDPDIAKAEENHYEGIVTAETLPELSEKLKISLPKLQSVITRYNSYCAKGYDEEFYKSHQDLHPITGEGGYLVGKFYSGAYGTVGGVKINENCEVQNDDGQTIPGLYSAGSDANTIYADSYNFTLPGNTMGFAVNSGRIAGSEAARKLLRDNG